MGEIAPVSPLIHSILLPMLDFYVKTGIRFSLRDKRLFEITEVEITRVDCICYPCDKDEKRKVNKARMIFLTQTL